MKPLESQINLRVVNNTALPQPVSILAIVPNQNTANNNNFLYEFNFTGQSYVGVTNVSINISNTSNPAVVVYNAPVTSQSIIGVVDALNSLNQGLFSYFGSTIYVTSNYYIYSNISIAGTSIFGTTTGSPYGLTIDSSGNVYTADGFPYVSKITPSGVSSIFATYPFPQNPQLITIDNNNNLYTANGTSNQVFKIDPLGSFGTYGGSAVNPSGITIDSLGNIYTCGIGSSTIFKIDTFGVTTNYGNIGTNNPTGLVCDSSGNIFVCCSGNDTIYKVTSAGVTTSFSTFPLSSLPIAITIDSSDNLYVAVQSLEYVSKITPLGVQTIYGVTGAGTLPVAIAIDNLTNIYTANSDLTITKILATGGSIIPLATIPSGFLSGIIVDSFYNVYVSNIVDNNVSLIVQ
jgi:sugar lactone lactonase YvrE